MSLTELTKLLDPISPEKFTTEYWCREPLFIKGSPEKIERLLPGGFQSKDFFKSVREAAKKRSEGYQLWLTAHRYRGLLPGDGGLVQRNLAIEPDQMEWMFASGFNVAADNLKDSRAAAFAAVVKAQLNHFGSIRVTATLSPKGNGWPPHVDPISSFFIQCEGRKRFLISELPVVEWPEEHTTFAGDSPAQEIAPIDMKQLTEVVLEPGDVLFIPPGTVHATEALSDRTLTMGLMLEHAGFLNLLSRALELMLQGNPEWHQLPPVNPALAEPGRLPVEAAEFFESRLDELRYLVHRLSPASPELQNLWHRFVADPGQLTSANLPNQV
jgi:ribosomal protein L16 Arg81 hydroxylase